MLSLAEKKKIVPKGKKLNPLKIKHKAENLYGPDYRKEIIRKLQGKNIPCSESLLSKAFTGIAPYILYQVNELLKEANLKGPVN